MNHRRRFPIWFGVLSCCDALRAWPGSRMKFRLVLAIVALLLVVPLVGGQASTLAGDWTGDSICAGNNPSCHDEKVVYHISVESSDPTKVKIGADKIVNGQLEFMGDINLKYDVAKQTLTGDMQSPRYRGVWEFSVKGNVIEGTLSIFLPENTIGRRMRVKKEI